MVSILINEKFRYLLYHGSHRNVQRQQVLLDAILTFLETHLSAQKPAPKTWLGLSSQLSFNEDGSALAAVALLRFLLDRNIGVIK